MPSGYIILPLAGAILPDGSGSGNNPPQPLRVVSSGAQTANTPKATAIEWAFDAAVDEHLIWQFLVPGNYGSGGTLRFRYRMATATSGSIVAKASECGADQLSDVENALSFDTPTTVTSAVPGTLGQVKEAAIVVGVWAAGAVQFLMFGRDADDAADTAAGDMILVGAIFEYETA